MNLTRRSAATALGLLLVTGTGTVVSASPASATVTTLCSGYTACARAGMGNDGYSSAGGSMYWRMYGGHNCTNYVAYRMIRAGLPNVRPWAGSGNATNWGSAMSRITTSTPAVGSVAWWRAGVKPAGSAGHVGYVEKVVSPTEIIVSQDSWHGDFSWTRITRTSSGWPSGFVHFADVRLRNLTVPAVSGATKVGSTLSATAGSWSIPGVTLGYQWLADGVALPQATSSTLSMTQTLVGKRISVRVSAAALGFTTTTATSLATAAVQPGALSSTAAPSISGDPVVDQPVTASPGTWTPAPDSVSYQWRADGAPVAGATGPTYTPTAANVGQAITVAATATKAGYPSVTRVSGPTSAVAPGALSLSTPTVAGTTRPGQALSVVLPTLPAGATAAVQWRRGNVVVPGVTGSRYPLTAADLGSRVMAQVQVTKPGYTPVTLRTVSSGFVRTPSAIRLTATAGTGRIYLRGTVVTRDAPPVDGVLQVRSRGRLLRSVPVTKGVVSSTVTGMPRGTRTYRFRLLTTLTVLGGEVQRHLRIH